MPKRFQPYVYNAMSSKLYFRKKERKKERLNQEARGKRQLQDIICGGSRYFLLRC